MPRKPIDYSKTIIYKICCKDPNIKDVYVGSTTDLYSRKRNHKTSCNNPNSKGYNYYVYQFIRENGGWNNWQIIMIKKYSKCESKQQCLKKERKYIEKLNATLNKQKPTRTKKEWTQDNDEKLKQYKKIYQENNKERIKIKKKEYHIMNRDYINNKSKIYRQENKELIKKKEKIYREKNKQKIYEKLNKKIQCECGVVTSLRNISTHRKSKKHLKFIEQNQ